VKRDDETDTFGRKGALSLPAFVPTTIRGYGAAMEFAEVDTRLLGAADRALFLSLSLSLAPNDNARTCSRGRTFRGAEPRIMPVTRMRMLRARCSHFAYCRIYESAGAFRGAAID